MEYYEESFIEFENFLIQTGYKNRFRPENPHANSEFYLQKFANYEKWMKADYKRQWRNYRKGQVKQDKKSKKPPESTELEKHKVSRMSKKQIDFKKIHATKVTFHMNIPLILLKRHYNCYVQCYEKNSISLSRATNVFLA